MANLTKRHEELLKIFDEEYKKDKELQKAIQTYLIERGLELCDNVVYEPGIDFVGVFVEDNMVLSIGLPPVSNYSIEETKYTDIYLRKGKSLAV